MRVTQTVLHSGSLDSAGFSALAATNPQLVLAFGAPDVLQASADAMEAALRFYADDDHGYIARIALAQHGSKA